MLKKEPVRCWKPSGGSPARGKQTNGAWSICTPHLQPPDPNKISGQFPVYQGLFSSDRERLASADPGSVASSSPSKMVHLNNCFVHKIFLLSQLHQHVPSHLRQAGLLQPASRGGGDVILIIPASCFSCCSHHPRVCEKSPSRCRTLCF